MMKKTIIFILSLVLLCSVAIATDKPRGNYLSLDGTGDYIDADGAISSSSFSMSVWINSDLSLSQQVIMGKNYGNTGGACYGGYDLRVFSNGLIAFYTDNTPESCDTLPFVSSSAGVISPNTWHHVMATFNSNTNTGNLYVDGTLVASESTMVIPELFPSKKFLIGSAYSEYTPDPKFYNFFEGSIDEVRIYDRALTDSEVEQEYERGIRGLKSDVTTNLVAYYDFETDFNDQEGSNDGTAYGDTYIETYDPSTTNFEGSGTSSDPYLISDCTELQNVEYDLSADYWMTNDFSCSGIANFVPIAQDYAYEGTFDGRNYEISDLVINRPTENYVALFGRSAGTIKNVGLVSPDIDGHNSVAGILGYSMTGSTTSNCYVDSGTINGHQTVSGIVASLAGSLEDSHNSASIVTSIYGSSNAGGVAGASSGTSSIDQCYNEGSVSGHQYVGGIIGNKYGSISNSYNAGSVSSTYSGTYPNTGGVVGVPQASSVTNTYNIGYVANTGLCSGAISGNGCGIFNSVWLTGSHSVRGTYPTCTGVFEKDSGEMKTESTFTSLGWDFTNIWAIDSSINSGYPYLRGVEAPIAETFGAGSTDLDNLDDYSAVDLVLTNDNNGKIDWTNTVDLVDENLEDNIIIGEGFVSMNTANLGSSIHNAPATVTLDVNTCNQVKIYYRAGFYDNLGDLLLGQVCDGSTTPACTSITCDPVEKTVTFDVTHFDGYGAQGEEDQNGGTAIPEFSTVGIIFVLLAIALVVIVAVSKKKE